MILDDAPMFGDNAPMKHPADFADAHYRHWEDAELLFRDSCWPNAYYLYGLSAECGLKAIMQRLGMGVDDSGTPQQQYMRHMPRLWSVFEDFARRHSGAMYLALLPDRNPFSCWCIHNRYAKRSFFERANIEPYQIAARQVGHAVRRAEQDGVL